MKTKLDSIVKMTPASDSAEWWALFLLELGKNAEYNLLIHYLTLAAQNKCLQEIRLAAERIVRSRANLIRRGPVKVRRSGTYKAVA